MKRMEGSLIRIPGLIGVILFISLISFLVAFYPTPLLAIGLALLVLIVGAFWVAPRPVILVLLFLRASLDITKGTCTLYLSEALKISPAFFSGLLLVGLGIFYVIRYRVKIFEIPLVMALSFFQLLLFVHLMVTQEPLAGLMESMRFLSIIVVYILVTDLFRELAQIRRLVLVILLSAVVPILVGLYQIMGEAGQYITGFVRANGTFVHPNPYAFYLVIILGLLLNNLLAGRHRVGRPSWLIILGLTGAFCLLLTYTRTAWIGLFILLFFAAFFKDRRFLWIFGGLVGIFILAAPLRMRFYDLATGLNSVTHRFFIWEAGLKQLPAYPLLGRGPASFELLDIYGEQAHNDLLRIFVELGVLGALSYLFIAVELVGRFWKMVCRRLDLFSSALARAVFSITCVFILASLTGNLFFRPALQWYYWSLVALAFNAARLSGGEGIER